MPYFGHELEIDILHIFVRRCGSMETIEEIEKQIRVLQQKVTSLQKVVEINETEIKAQITNLYHQLTKIANEADRLSWIIKRIKDSK